MVASVTEQRASQLNQPPLQNPAQRISLWLEYASWRMGDIAEREKFRNQYLEENVIQMEEIPESYYEFQRRIAREAGHQVEELTPERRQEFAQEVIMNQRASLGAWWDYLASEYAEHYPTWTRVFVLQEVARMGRFDSMSGSFRRRSKSDAARFPELNQEALAQVISEMDLLAKAGSRRMFSFAQSYAEQLRAATQERGNLSQTEGQWVKYPRGSSPHHLVASLSGWNTGWCTAAPSTAESHLASGDFFVYFSLDQNGVPRVPRLAIRMGGSRIFEVRGVAPGQMLDADIAATTILDHKLAEFGKEGSQYIKRNSDMRRLTEIERRTSAKQTLSLADTWFLYEMSGRIEALDPKVKDWRAKEVRGMRKEKLREDLAALLTSIAYPLDDGQARTQVNATAARLEAGGLTNSVLQTTGKHFIDLIRNSITSQSLSAVISVVQLVSPSPISIELRKQLAASYVARVAPYRLASEAVRFGMQQGKQGRESSVEYQFAREILALTEPMTNTIPVMLAFKEIDRISKADGISLERAAKRWLSDTTRSDALKVEFLHAVVTSIDYDQWESHLPAEHRAEILQELDKKTMARRFRELAKARNISAEEFSRLSPESFDVITIEFPMEGRKVTLGSPLDEEERREGEKLREVLFTKSFRLQATSVTNGQYRIFLEVTGVAPDKLSQIKTKDPNEPVGGVDWHEASAFANWYAKIDPTMGRLPTDAEREYATRAGTSTRFWSGDETESLAKVAWFDENSEPGVLHPVAELLPNPFGLYDVHGNIWEWCQDSFQYTLDESIVDPVVELGPGSDRVVRGGCEANTSTYLRSASRLGLSPDTRYHNVGFRLAGTP